MDARQAFHIDEIQGIVSRYASKPFEIGIGYGTRAGQEYPVILVQSGVVAPVAVKSDLFDSTGKRLLQIGDVYFRSLHANGTASSTKARPEDWSTIIEICSDNREANIGLFIRRQLSGLHPNALRDIGTAFLGLVGNAPLSSEDSMRALLQHGDRFFDEAMDVRGFDHPGERTLLGDGMFDTAVLLRGDVPEHKADRPFRDLLYSSYPNYVYDMPILIDSRHHADQRNHPRMSKRGWQSLIVMANPKSSINLIQFVRLDPSGKFYMKKMLDDDMFAAANNFQPLSAFDPSRQIVNVSDAISAGLAFGRAMGCDPQATIVAFGFRWTKLRNRRIWSWSSPVGKMLGPLQHYAQDDVIESFIDVPLDTAISAISPFVLKATEELLLEFDFDEHIFGPSYIDNLVRSLIGKR
jgi:hypothetical protein